MQFRAMTREDQEALEVIGRAIRIARVRAAMSQRRLASTSGVSQTAISRMERGLVWGMGIIYFARVARILGDALTLAGCPHGHDCDFGRQWAAALREISPELVRHRGHRSSMGSTLFELLRRAESEPDEPTSDDPLAPARTGFGDRGWPG